MKNGEDKQSQLAGGMSALGIAETTDSSPMTSFENRSSSGFDNSLPLEDPKLVRSDEKYICPVHKGLLRDAVQTSCGHRMCSGCVEIHLEGDISRMCPANEEDCELVKRDNILPDPGFRREMKHLLVYCSNKGCSAQVKFFKLQQHLDQCEFRTVDCPLAARGCQEKPLYRNLETHKNHCDYRPASCELCGVEFNVKDKKDHETNLCPESIVTCPFSCGLQNLKRKRLEEHKGSCPQKPTECRFAALGCKFVGHKTVVEDHEKDTHLHLQVLLHFATASEVQRLETRRECQELRDAQTLIQQKHDRLDNQLKSNNREIRLKLVEQVERLIQSERKLEEFSKERFKFAEEIKQHDQSIEQLKNLITQVADLERQISTHSLRMAENDLRFQMIETASYDGSLLWKIRDFAQRKRDAVQGRTVSLYSQPFYTSRFGYKMCARVYLNGDGIGRGTHMSLYFVVMRGEYDALQIWPFQHKVSLILLDQSLERRHLKDEFYPDPTSTSFRRPVNAEMNVASGCPLFVAHTVLDNPGNHYVREDMLFIKVVVDPSQLQTI